MYSQSCDFLGFQASSYRIKVMSWQALPKLCSRQMVCLVIKVSPSYYGISVIFHHPPLWTTSPLEYVLGVQQVYFFLCTNGIIHTFCPATWFPLIFPYQYNNTSRSISLFLAAFQYLLISGRVFSFSYLLGYLSMFNLPDKIHNHFILLLPHFFFNFVITIRL